MTTSSSTLHRSASPGEPAPSAASRFWRYWAGSTVSRVGDAVTAVALPLTALGVAHATAFQVGVVTAAGFAGWVVIGLPAGVLVERLPIRGTQIAMDLVRGTSLATIPLAWWFATVTVWQLVAVALVNGFASVIFDVGNSTMLPFLVGKEELTARNSLTSGTQAVTQLAGPSLGGVLVQAIGAAASLVVDVVSFLMSAVILRSVPRPPRAATRPDGDRPSVPAAIRAGWTFVVRNPLMLGTMLDATAINFVCGATTALTPLFLVRTLGLHAASVGVLIAAEGAGSLVGAALAPRLSRRLGSARTALVMALACPATVALLPLATAGWGQVLFALGNAAFAATTVVASILFRTYRHVATPTELLPRVMATVRFVSWGVFPLGALAAGTAAAWLGPRTALWCAAAAAVLPAVVAVGSPMRTQREFVEG